PQPVERRRGVADELPHGLLVDADPPAPPLLARVDKTVRLFCYVVIQDLVGRVARRVVRIGEPERSPAPAELARESVDASRIGANEVPRHDTTGDANHALVGQAARVRRAVDSMAARAAAVAEERAARLLLRRLLRAALGVSAQVGS